MKKKMVYILILLDILLIIYNIYDLKISYTKNNIYLEEISFDPYDTYNNLNRINILDNSFLFVKALDNEYYLNHDINGNENKFGTIFMDYRCNFEKLENCILYGHSSKSYNLPFNDLINYKDLNYLNNNKLFSIVINNKLYNFIINDVISTYPTILKDYLYIQTCDQQSNGLIILVAKKI